MVATGCQLPQCLFEEGHAHAGMHILHGYGTALP